MPLDLAAVYGTRETALTDGFTATLPENTAPAPWTVRASAVVWWNRATPGATEALPPTLRDRARAAVVIGGMVRYSDTPVGAYDEVFGAIGFRLGRRLVATIPFMAVDSPSSLVGGRDNWAIPKTLAEFTGSPETGSEFTVRSATGPEWRISAAPNTKGPRLPVFSRAMVAQEFPDGSLRGTRLQARGRMRLASSMVTVESTHGLPSWLSPGRHRGAVISGTTFTLGAPARL